MNILLLASHINAIGGIQRSNRLLLETLRELGQNPVALQIIFTHLSSKVFFVFRFIVKVLFDRPNFIICTNINYSPLGYWAKRILNIDYSVSMYGVDAESILNAFVKNLLLSRCIVVPFSFTAQNISRQIPEVEHKIIIIQNSVRGDEFIIKPKSQKLLDRHHIHGENVIVTVTRLSVLDRCNKGYERVIQAMPIVLRRAPNTKYLLIGGGNDLDAMRRFVKELALEKNVILVGPVPEEERVDYYNLADVFILPSYREGFPALVLLEALACGKPVIGGDQEGAEGALLNGKLGIIVKHDDVPSIASALIRFLERNVPDHLLQPKFLRSTVLDSYGHHRYMENVKSFVKFISPD